MKRSLCTSDRRQVTERIAEMDRIARVEFALRVVLAAATRTEIDLRNSFDLVVRRWVIAAGAAAVFARLTRDASKLEVLLTLDAMFEHARRDVVYRSVRRMLASAADARVAVAA